MSSGERIFVALMTAICIGLMYSFLFVIPSWLLPTASLVTFLFVIPSWVTPDGKSSYVLHMSLTWGFVWWWGAYSEAREQRKKEKKCE